jgi:hypothetical protein
MPGSDPGGASIFYEQNRSFASAPSKRPLSNWTTVDYRPASRRRDCGAKPLIHEALVVRGTKRGGCFEDLQPRAVRGCVAPPTIGYGLTLLTAPDEFHN